MIDRAHLERVLQEQGVQNAGAVGSQTTLNVGQLVGPSAMLEGRMTRCTVGTSGPLIVPGPRRDSPDVRRLNPHASDGADDGQRRPGRFHDGQDPSGMLVDARASGIARRQSRPAAADRDAHARCLGTRFARLCGSSSRGQRSSPRPSPLTTLRTVPAEAEHRADEARRPRRGRGAAGAHRAGRRPENHGQGAREGDLQPRYRFDVRSESAKRFRCCRSRWISIRATASSSKGCRGQANG